MHKHMKILTGTVLLAAAGWFAGCNGTIDDEPNVVLEVATLTIPVIQAQTTTTCIFTITQASATFNNKPKNHLAGESPFQDIVMESVDVSYVWDDGAVLPNQTFGVPGTVPANGTQSSTFSVVNNSVLTSGAVTRAGHTASLSLVFHGHTVSGDAVLATTGGTLSVNSCP